MITIRLPSLAALVAALALASAPAAAQDGPPGIAFAQAEEGSFWCQAHNPDDGFACALQQCEAGANGPDCIATAWCAPARWSGLLTVWFSDFHATMPLCGMPSREVLEAAAEAICTADPAAWMCNLTTLIDPDGNETDAGREWVGGGGG